MQYRKRGVVHSPELTRLNCIQIITGITLRGLWQKSLLYQLRVRSPDS